MSIDFNIKTRITVNGKEYASKDDLPPDIRALYEQAMATPGRSLKFETSRTRFTFNGQTYGSVEEMPAEARTAYQNAMQAVESGQGGDGVTVTRAVVSGSDPGALNRLFPPALLEWKEPAHIRSGQDAVRRRRGKPVPLLIGILAVPVILVQAMVGRVENAGILAVAVGVMYLVLWLYRHLPALIRVTPNGITRSVGNTAHEWKFSETDHCEIVRTMVGRERVTVLVIESRDGKRDTIGMAESIPVDSLRTVLENAGVRVDVRTG